MRKIIIIAILSVCSIATQAQQVGLTVTNTVTTNDGTPATNLYCEALFNVVDLISTGKVYCELNFYNSYAMKVAGYDHIYPIVNGDKVVRCTITVNTGDVIKQSGQSTMADVVTLFYSKVKAQLLSQYGLTCN